MFDLKRGSLEATETMASYWSRYMRTFEKNLGPHETVVPNQEMAYGGEGRT
jgi:hypothetical protein